MAWNYLFIYLKAQKGSFKYVEKKPQRAKIEEPRPAWREQGEFNIFWQKIPIVSCTKLTITMNMCVCVCVYREREREREREIHPSGKMNIEHLIEVDKYVYCGPHWIINMLKIHEDHTMTFAKNKNLL